MAEEVFVDANFWVALADSSDQHFLRAQRLWDTTVGPRWAKITTNWTLYEALTFLSGRKARHDLAVDVLDLARISAEVLDAGRYEDGGLGVFVSHADKQWSVVDCTSFMCIQDRHCAYALSFDRDFVQAQNEFGFIVMPQDLVY